MSERRIEVEELASLPGMTEKKRDFFRRLLEYAKEKGHDCYLFVNEEGDLCVHGVQLK